MDITQAPNWVFDAALVQPSQGQQVIPAATYPVVISNTELKPTKDTKGAYFDVSYTVTEGPYAGAVLHDRFNIINDSVQAVGIAQGNLSALCHAVNIQHLTMRDQGAAIRGARLMVAVTVRTDANGQQNDVKTRFDAMGNEPGKAGARPMVAAGPQPGMPAQAPQGGAPPAAAWGAPAPQGQPPAPAYQPPAPAAWGAPPAGGPAPGLAPVAGNGPAAAGAPAWGAPAPALQPAPAPAAGAWAQGAGAAPAAAGAPPAWAAGPR